MGKNNLDKLHEQLHSKEIDTFFSLSSLDLQKIGVVLKEVGPYLATSKKFRAILEYDPERDKYDLSIKFYESGIPEEILAAQKAELEYHSSKK